MLKIAHEDDYKAVLERSEGASSSVAHASIRIMTSHFVALLCDDNPQLSRYPQSCHSSRMEHLPLTLNINLF